MPRSVSSSAIWLRGTSQLRRRWRAWLGLAVLIGLTGGAVIGAAAGARRTSSAYDRLASSAQAFDVVLAVGCAGSGESDCSSSDTGTTARILDLPEVADGAVVANFLMPVLDEEGLSIQPQTESGDDSGAPPGVVCFTGSGEVDVMGSPDGVFGTRLNRHRFVSGRPANPARADEVVVSVATARRAGIAVGDVLRIVPVDACGDVPQHEWPEPIEVTVVGLQVSPGEVQPQAGRYLQSVTVTSTLLEELAPDEGAGGSAVAVRLADGVDEEQLREALQRAGIMAEPIISGTELAASVRQGHRQDAASLWLLVALGGVAALVVLGQALAREIWAGADEVPALRAIGFSRREIVLAGAIEGAGIALVAGLLSWLVAAAASPLTPISRARSSEPDPGFRIDAVAMGLGVIVVVVTTVVIVVGVSTLVAKRVTSVQSRRARPGMIAAALARSGLPASAPVGAHLALSRGDRARPVPVRSGVAAMAVGFAALVGSLVFGADLEHLLGTPRLVGWNWEFVGDLELQTPADPGGSAVSPIDAADELLRRARAVEGVERAGYATFFPPSDLSVIETLPDVRPISFSSGPGSIGPTVIFGRAPAGPEEVLLTASVLEDLELQIGDDLEAQALSTDESGEPVVEVRSLTIVGTGVLPLGDGTFDRGVALTFDGLRALAPDAQPQLAVVDLHAGADRGATLAALSELGLQLSLSSDDVDVTELVDLDVQQADNVPRLFGALMALLGLGVLMHLVLTGLRAGRHELATLRALGFSTRQVRAAAAWQATIVTVMPFALGAIAGLVAGRLVWLSYANHLNVAPATVLAWRPIVGFLLSFLVVANLIGAVAAWRLARQRPAVELRTE